MSDKDLELLSDVPVDIEARLDMRALRVSELLAFQVGSVVVTPHSAGKNVDVFAGEAFIGSGELSSENGRPVVRMAHFTQGR